MIHHTLLKKISCFARKNIMVNLNIKVTDQRMNLIEQGIDLAIRIGKLEDNKASLKRKKLTDINHILVAGKALMQGRQTPQTPKDIENWPWIGLTMLPFYRNISNSQGVSIRLNFQPTICVDNVEAMTELARQGVGLATVPDYLVADALLSGELVHLLPEWQIEPIEVFAVWPIQINKTSLSYFLMDYLYK